MEQNDDNCGDDNNDNDNDEVFSTNNVKVDDQYDRGYLKLTTDMTRTAITTTTTTTALLLLLSKHSCPRTPEGRLGMPGVSPLSGISGLSLDSTLLSPLLFFCLALLPFLSYRFRPAGPFF